ncbi:2-polyprenyl-6-methoxyphenol hydroxylase-like FAD-dependent oxidoreductase [Luteibacter rhizovicinus]|uniref:2-polyprenyl-6-methoxyphenol hydroxylase-like FAD-dependent oxidoreductase n=1 Tax=Luteibacter rhizovicinus TaxID=242606 RepID=A0A4R3YV61_9GAMM|nr:NAD(P)/FAD-dependent oxidoreductase [Luteibacter rhizovicinus]TCV96382.1 2-polyprenyl-6-methoxyphenol hydroxylase-like FAD-dependent oxidoreductase [Luteibacter rhizovicinus]
MKVAIVGYGTAGQAAALFLSAQGHDVTVFEKSPVLGPVGAGFLLQPTGLAVLARLGLHEKALALGQRIDELHGATPRGRPVMAMRYRDHRDDCFGVGMTRGALFELLRESWPGAAAIRTGVYIESYDADAHTLRDSEGSIHGPYELVVAADGAHSALRAGCEGHVARETIYPWGAVWCLLPADDWPTPTQLQQRYSGTRSMIGMLPVGKRPGHEGNWATFFFSLPGEAVDRFDDEAVAAMRDSITAIWPELGPRVAHLVSASQLQKARYRDVVLRCPHHARMVVIGDAAHAMSPQLGQGANMALLDAAALADALADHGDVDKALDAYRRERRGHVRTYQYMSRWLTPLFQSDHGLLGWWRDAFFGPMGKLPGAKSPMLKILTGEASFPRSKRRRS